MIWPRAWADHYGNVDRAMLRNEWSLGLAGLTGEQIKRAIEHHRNASTWPPSVAEFRQAATGGATPEQRAFAARAGEDALPALPADTRAEQLARGAAEAQRLKRKDTPRPTRTLRNIAQGLWTREMEADYAQSAAHLGITLTPIDWPEAAACD